jgi:bifunctional non-homologous end joining protein LigD
MLAKQHVDVEGQRLILSNLDKILYPDFEFTKGQVIDYYITVSRWILPHLADRPVPMLRFRDGVRGKGSVANANSLAHSQWGNIARTRMFGHSYLQHIQCAGAGWRVRR